MRCVTTVKWNLNFYFSAGEATALGPSLAKSGFWPKKKAKPPFALSHGVFAWAGNGVIEG